MPARKSQPPTPDPPAEASQLFIDGMGRIADFWGVGRVMGRLWAVLYLSPEPMSMDQLVDAVGITKGHASINLRGLSRVGLVRKSWKPNDRRDYYAAETDLWAFAKGFLRVRQDHDFDRALHSTTEALRILEAGRSKVDSAGYAFLHQRLSAVREFHAGIDRAVQALLRLDDFRTAIARLAPGKREKS